jgi:hypothetical protein
MTTGGWLRKTREVSHIADLLGAMLCTLIRGFAVLLGLYPPMSHPHMMMPTPLLVSIPIALLAIWHHLS